ncbi:hypothetical protein ABUO68_000441 [Escherichia coli]|uniref:hypothetical protein n=1 Tax=Escherichia coli TaxID=562 RepID=UPI000391222E|nr:hypothetical protein [Escherichia coli]EFV8062856.1 hypothetical protein [Shigella sonnei]EER8055893.1 hypothetical protein [Escherichia coli]EES2680002.1 hypothetical protein [Escherichia coli]EEV5734782.1 hypothetical protein [Escherichia coli]EEW3638579.1 hypothetical protein [Escherichia coli]
MWAALIVIVLVCGYHYTNCHLPSRYRQSKAIGWNAYFDVALKGGEFLISGILIAALLVVVLYAGMSLWNIPAYLFGWYAPFTFAHDFLKMRVFGLSMFPAMSIAFTIIVSIGKASEATKNHKDPQKRKAIFEEIAAHSAVENILLESVERGLLLLVTLKSRKVYVGMIDEARFNQLDTHTLVLIPFMSGYRDKDTLTFCVEHNYVDYYLSQGITLTSEPLSVYQFRHVLPFDQIESFSLFNVETFETFKAGIEGKKATEVQNQTS